MHLLTIHRALGRHFAAVALLALTLPAGYASAAEAPTSWNYPLLPHVPALALWPGTPNDQQPTTVELSAVYTGECWMVQDQALVDDTLITVTLAPDPNCPGDSASSWVRSFELGVLPAGIHPLTISATLLHPGSGATQEQISIGFEVVHYSPPPPPVPGDSTAGMLVTSIEVLPDRPTPSDPVTVRLSGRYPFDCGELLNPTISGLDLALTLHPGGCGDTTKVWAHDFAVGLLPAGRTTLVLDVAAERAGDVLHEAHAIDVFVTDPNAPPPPPPGDSLKTMLSPGHPNPFRDETRFSVSLLEPRNAEVAVFDLGGRRVATVFRGLLPVGTSQLAWNGRRSDGTRASGGIYFYRLTLPDRVVTRRVVLLGRP